MFRRCLLLLVSALSLTIADVANSAELPIKAPVYKGRPYSGPSYSTPSWTGFYAGLNAGYGWGSESATLAPTQNLFDIFGDGGLPRSAQLKPAGFLGGAQLGYNYQLSSFVLGAEADFQYSTIKDTFKVHLPGDAFVGAATTIEQKMDWFATARLRAGYLIADPLLVYVTGGLAMAKLSESATFLLDNGDSVAGSTSATKTGSTWGGGAEWAFAEHWTMKAEYLHYQFGDATINMHEVVSPFPRGATVTIPLSGNLVRAGLNYRF